MKGNAIIKHYLLLHWTTDIVIIMQTLSINLTQNLDITRL